MTRPTARILLLGFACLVAENPAYAAVLDTTQVNCIRSTTTPAVPSAVPISLQWAGVGGSLPVNFFSATFDNLMIPRKLVLTADNYHLLEDAIGYAVDGFDSELTLSIAGVACPAIPDSTLFTVAALDLQGLDVRRISIELTELNVVTPGTDPAGSDVTAALTLRFTDEAQLSREEIVPDGTLCPRGGRKLMVGYDNVIFNELLDDAEVTDTAYVCDPLDAFDARVIVSAEPAGPECANGGFKIESGLDDDRNGTLDPLEIDNTEYACNGGTGPAGPTGATGEAGTVGPQGEPGATGASGASSECVVSRQDANTVLVSCPNGQTTKLSNKGGCTASGTPWFAAVAVMAIGYRFVRRSRR